jgi:hypothetical protein
MSVTISYSTPTTMRVSRRPRNRGAPAYAVIKVQRRSSPPGGGVRSSVSTEESQIPTIFRIWSVDIASAPSVSIAGSNAANIFLGFADEVRHAFRSSHPSSRRPETWVIAPKLPATSKASRPALYCSMRLLVLGGTAFPGRHIVQHALSQGQQSTLFNRGKRNPRLLPGVEHLRGNRNSGRAPLMRRKRDGVIDTSGSNQGTDGISRDRELEVLERF